MVWREVVQAVLEKLKSDGALQTLLDGGAHIYRAKSRASIRTPGVYYTVVSGRVEENTSTVVIQWDVWAPGAIQLADIELRLYELMHSDMPVEIDGLRMWSQYRDSHDLDSDDQSRVGRGLEYEYRPARLNG